MFFISIVNSAFWVYEAMIFARVILSWIPHDRSAAPLDMLYAATDPLISTCREIMYSIFRLIGLDARQTPLDFSPLLALLFLHALRGGVVRLLLMFAQ
jgi:YggT family protein